MITFKAFKRSVLDEGRPPISKEAFWAGASIIGLYNKQGEDDKRIRAFPALEDYLTYYYDFFVQNMDAYLLAWYKKSIEAPVPDSFRIPQNPIVDGVIKNKPFMISVIRSFFNDELQLCGGRQGISFRTIIRNIYYRGKFNSCATVPSVFKHGKLSHLRLIPTMRTAGGVMSVFSPITYAALLSRASRFSAFRPASLLCPTASWGTPVIAANALGYEKLGIVDVIPAVIDKLPKLLATIGTRRPPSLFGVKSMALDSFCIPSERMLDEVTGIYDQVFFCPPYFDLELYGGGEQSTESFPTYEEWLEGYWRKTVENCFDAMKEGGAFSFVMSNKLNGCYIGPDMLDIAEDYFRHCDAVRVVPNKRPSSNYDERYETCYTLIKEEY